MAVIQLINPNGIKLYQPSGCRVLARPARTEATLGPHAKEIPATLRTVASSIQPVAAISLLENNRSSADVTNVVLVLCSSETRECNGTIDVISFRTETLYRNWCLQSHERTNSENVSTIR